MDVDLSAVKQNDSNNDLRLRGSAAVGLSDTLSGTIHPFLSSNQSFFSIMFRDISLILREPQAKKIMLVTCLNLLCTVVLLLWCNSSNSMALTAYAYLTIYDIFSLLTCLVSIWVRMKKPSPIFSFGYERFEVLSVFASTILAQLGAFFIIKESVERMVQQPEIHTSRLLVGTTLAFFFHMAVTYGIENKAFNHVIEASSSSWLQEHVADMSESLCHVIPNLSKVLLPRINPFSLIAFAGAAALGVTYIVIDINNYFAADTWAAVWIAVMTCGTMFPMSVYSGKILIQTTPSHMIGQLDKCIREASTLDGVLEFRHEHFWTLSFGTMSGTVHVRVRRDADEQMVLAHVYNRLSNLVSVLTIQIFKDDWATRPSSFQIIGDGNFYSGATANNVNAAAKSAAGRDHNVSPVNTYSPPITPSQPARALPSTTVGSTPTYPVVPGAGATGAAMWGGGHTAASRMTFQTSTNSLPPTSHYSSPYRTASPNLGNTLSGFRPSMINNTNNTRLNMINSINTTKPNVTNYSGTGLTQTGSVFSMQGTLGNSASFGMKAMQFSQNKFH